MAREPKKIDASALRQTVYSLIFVTDWRKLEKTEKKTKIENLQNGQEKYDGKNLAYVHIWVFKF